VLQSAERGAVFRPSLDGPFTVYVRDMIAEAERRGLGVPWDPPDKAVLVVSIARVEVLPEALRLQYRIEEGPFKGEFFFPFKWNLTPRGIHRFAQLCRAWGVSPAADDSTESIAQKLKGRRARVVITQEAIRGMPYSDVKPEHIQLLKEDS
jgi:hypothetical protein